VHFLSFFSLKDTSLEIYKEDKTGGYHPTLHLEDLSYLVTPWRLPYMDASLHKKRMAFTKGLNKKDYKEGKEKKKVFVFINKPENFNKTFPLRNRLLKLCA